MAARDITLEDLATAFWNLCSFETFPDYRVNVWGRDGRGRMLKVALVPEVRYIITVACVDHWTVGDALRANL